MSVGEKLAIIAKVGYTLAKVGVAMFVGIFRTSSPNYYRYTAFAALRNIFAVTTTKQQHYLNPPTDDVYQAFCKKHNLQPETETLADGTTGHWIGPKTASKIIVNFHGGGYTIPPLPEMFDFQYQMQQKFSQQDKNVAVFFLSYDLAPVAKYPRQLTQAALLIDHLVNTLNKKPSDLVLIGDSAGGNLITQVLSHISHPHPTVPALNISENFRGACLISPWVDFKTSYPSFTKNKDKDILAIPIGRKWSSAFMPTPWPHEDSTDFYNQASTAPKEWWEGVMVEEILLLGGEDEVLIDGIKRFGETLKGALGDKVTTLYIENEMHDHAVIDLMIGYKEHGATAQAIIDWVGSKL